MTPDASTANAVPPLRLNLCPKTSNSIVWMSLSEDSVAFNLEDLSSFDSADAVTPTLSGRAGVAASERTTALSPEAVSNLKATTQIETAKNIKMTEIII